MKQKLYLFLLLILTQLSVFSQIGTHLNCDGFDDRVTIPNTFNLENEVTIEVWIKTASDGRILMNLDVAGNLGYGSSLMVTNGKLRFLTYNNFGSFSMVSQLSVNDNVWHHIALTMSTSNSNELCKLYIDGFLDTSSNAGNLFSPIKRLWLALGGSGNQGYFNGSMDELRIWNVIRTAEEINGSKDTEINCNEPGLVGYYQFNRGIGAGTNTNLTSLIDITGNGFNGTLGNFSLSGTTSNWLSGSPIISLSSPPLVVSPVTYAFNETATALTATSTINGINLLWYTNAIGGVGISTITPSTTTAGTTSYYVSNGNTEGCESERAEIKVIILPPDLISTQPANSTIDGGKNTTFSVLTTGTIFNQNWEVSYDGGTTFNLIVDDLIYSGATTSILTVNKAPISLNGAKFRLKLFNGTEVVSDIVTLTVNIPTFDTNRIWNTTGTAGFSSGAANYTVTVSDFNGTPYVAFRDVSNNNKLSVMKFNGNNWIPVGTLGFSTLNNVYNITLAFDSNNIPYVAYLGGSNVVQVNKFNGTSWQNVGTALTNVSDEISLAIDPSGNPVIAYSDSTLLDKTTVRKFNGTSWELVGTAGFTTSSVYDSSLAVDKKGIPYLVYRDENDGFPVAMKFNGSAWVTVGPAAGFYPDVAFYTDIAIDRAGTPYVTFINYSSDTLVVMKFNGTAWVAVGNTNIGSGVLYNSSIALDAAGTPFIIYLDFNNANKATIKRFDGTNWSSVGNSGFTTASAETCSLSLDDTGTIYATFVDSSLSNKITVLQYSEDPQFVTTWVNQAWTNGVPNINLGAVIKDVLTMTTNLTARELKISYNGSIVVTSGNSLTVKGKITNNRLVSNFLVKNNGILLQQDEVQNEGPITVNVNSYPLYRQDYTLWSSPTKNQNLRNFSPETLFNRFSTYNGNLGSQGQYVQELFTPSDVATKVFKPATGYQVRMPNDWPEFVNTSISGVSYAGVFKGESQNGTISVPLTTSNTGFNLIGNPYPSPISISSFFAATENQNIEKTIYFWRKRNDAIGSGYATLNSLGFTSAQPELTGVLNGTSNEIKPGQGFLVKSTGATQAVFKNSMRVNSFTGVFLRNSNTEKHRLWLNLNNSIETISQTLIGYTDGATQAIDSGLDAAYFNDSSVALTSLIDNNEYSIQGLGLPFDATRVVPLGFKTNVAGSYSVSLSDFDGLFASNQDIFLRDNLNGQVHDLKNAPYNFTTESGIFNQRFSVVYQNTILGTNNNLISDTTTYLYKRNGNIHIDVTNTLIKNVKVYDINGRLLYNVNNVGKNRIVIDNLNIANQVLLVKIESVDNQTVTKKMVY